MCLRVRALKEKPLELSTPNLVHNLWQDLGACIDPEVKGSKVKVTPIINALLTWMRRSIRYDCS